MGCAEMFAAHTRELMEEQETLAAAIPQFDNKDEAYAYAQRLLRLQPGTIVKVPYGDDNALHEGVYFSRTDAADVVVLVYNPKTRCLCHVGYDIIQLVLPDVE